MEREEIEKKLIQYDINHHKKVFDSPLFKDRIYKRLNEDEVRDRIFQSQINRIECDSSKVFEYLKLFKYIN